MDDVNTLKKRIEKLEAENKALSTIFEAMGDLVFVVNNDSVVTRVNAACAAFLKTKPQNIIGKKCHELFHKLGKPWPGCPFEEMKKDGKIHVEEVNDPNIGLTLLVTASPIFDEKEALVGAVHEAKDITGHKKKEQALYESEIKYKTVFETSSDAIMMLRPQKGFISGNAATIKIFRCKNEKEFITQSPASLSPEYQLDGKLSSVKAQEMMAIALEKGSHFFEWTHKRLDGNEFPATVLLTRLELQGEKLLQATVRDITELKQKTEFEARMTAVVRNSEDAIIGKKLDGTITSWNKGAETIYGYSEDEILGKNTSILVPPDYQDEMTNIFEKLKRGESVEHFETVRLRKNGDRIYMSISISPIKDSMGNITGALSVERNITDRRLAEEVLAKKLRDLEIFYKAAVDREMRIKELKKRVAELEAMIKS